MILRTENHLRSIVAVNPNSLGFTLRYRVDVTIGSPSLGKDHPSSIKDLSRYIMRGLPQDLRFKDKLLVENVHILLSANADLSINIRVKHHSVALEFVTEGLRRIRGVQTASTIQQAWSYIDEFVIGEQERAPS
jgi:DNA-binding Lrp family transcriptional regulator